MRHLIGITILFISGTLQCSAAISCFDMPVQDALQEKDCAHTIYENRCKKILKETIDPKSKRLLLDQEACKRYGKKNGLLRTDSTKKTPKHTREKMLAE